MVRHPLMFYLISVNHHWVNQYVSKTESFQDFLSSTSSAYLGMHGEYLSVVTGCMGKINALLPSGKKRLGYGDVKLSQS